MSIFGREPLIPETSAFGEASVSEPTPKVQVAFAYNINPQILNTRNNKGTTSVSNNKAQISTGAATGQSAELRSRIPLQYHPGQGALVRFTAIYTNGKTGSSQYIGIGSSGDGFFFGYKDTKFGILRRFGGIPEVRTLTVSTGSSTDEDITITINGNVKSDVAVTNTGDTTLTASEIAAADYSDLGTGWVAHSMGNTIIFESFDTTENKGGVYTLSGAATAVGLFAQSLVAVAATDVFTAQTKWSEDKFLNSSEPIKSQAGQTLNTSKGNVFQIRYQWLGFGMVSFYITNPDTGKFVLVHKIMYANKNTLPSISNPTLPLCIIVKNTLNNTDLIIQTSSMGGFIEGKETENGLSQTFSVESGGIGTTETPVLSIHSHTIFQGSVNRVIANLTTISIGVDGTKPAIVRLRKNAVLTGASFSAHNVDSSVIRTDTSATAISGGDVVVASTISKSGNETIDLQKLGTDLLIGETLSLTVEASSGSTDVVASIGWKENF